MNKLRKIQVSPFWGAVIASLAVFAGALVSLYADEIKNSFPIYLSLNLRNYGDFSIIALSFWLLFLLFILLTAYRQYFIDTDLNTQRQSLINILQSLPPHDFSLKYRDLYRKNDNNVEGIRSLVESFRANETQKIQEADIIVIEESIRVLLDAYINLAQIWDNPESVIDKDTIYRANIMAFYHIDKLPERIDSKLSSYNNFFVDKNIESIKASIDAVLVLEDNKLTTTTETIDPSPDKQIKPFILPVTFQKTKGKRFQNIPGAPRSVADGKAQWISDTAEILNICKNEDHFDKEILDKIESYYDLDTKGKSIISIPLYYDNEKKIILGTINIYRNKKLILRNEVRAEEFCAYLEPFNSLLCNLLSFYSEACGILDLRDKS